MWFPRDAVVTLAGLLTVSQAASIIPRSDVQDACGRIHDLTKTSESKITKVPGELYLECLKAWPFDSKRAVEFVKQYRKYMQWQSSIEILKDPPADYPMPPTDLLGGLDEIQNKAEASKYAGHYDFDEDLTDLVDSAYDGHFSVELCSSSVFLNDAPLVSISSDGTDVPAVYTMHDAALLKEHKDKVSSVVSINGVDVDKYLLDMTLSQKAQDWDSLYNNAFFSNPLSIANNDGESALNVGVFAKTSRWPGAYQALHFSNGSTTVFDTYVKLLEFPFKSGKQAWAATCLPTNATQSKTPKRNVKHPWKRSDGSKDQNDDPVGYPKPNHKTENNTMMAFFPDTENLRDVAVLVVPTFEVDGIEPEFADLARDFLAEAANKKKKKVIVDLQGNGGGLTQTGYNLFRQFFPEVPIYSAARFRAHEGLDFVGEALSRVPEHSDIVDDTILDWRAVVKPDQKGRFSSWGDLFGPYKAMGVDSSALFSYNMSYDSALDTPINGYGPVKANPSKTTFAAEDIVLLTDGFCASTCTIFVELMKAQGVRTIAFGGRPRNGPMQGMGGVKGAQLMDLDMLVDAFAEAKKRADKAEKAGKPLLSNEDLEKWNKYVPIPIDDFPFKWNGGGVNLLNSFGPRNDHLPRQFMYEAAECRRFFTYDNIVNMETTWSSAADAMFHDGGCVPGSANATGSLFAPPASGRKHLMALMLELASS